VAVHKENVVFFALIFLDASVLVEFMGDDNFVVGIVFSHLVQLALVVLDLLHESGNVGQRLQRRLRVADRSHENGGGQQKPELHKLPVFTSGLSSWIISRYAGTVRVVPC